MHMFGYKRSLSLKNTKNRNRTYKPTLCCTSQWGKKIQKYKKRYTKTQVQKNIQKKYKNLNWVGEASEAEVCNEGAGSRRNYKHWVTAARTDGASGEERDEDDDDDDHDDEDDDDDDDEDDDDDDHDGNEEEEKEEEEE